MLPLDANKNSHGFTLIEIVIILFIIGILSAIAVPSFLGLLNRGKVNNAVAQVQGALQEAQRESLRKSKQCAVTIDATLKEISGSCLVTGVRTLPEGVAIVTNVNGDITFGFRGNTEFAHATGTTSETTGNIILYQPDTSSSAKKCVAVSKGIGIIRFGTYDGSIATAADITDGICKQIEQ